MDYSLVGQLFRLQHRSQTELCLRKIGIVLQRLIEILLRFVELIGLAMQFAEFVGRVGICWIDLQFLLKLLHCCRQIIRRMTLPISSHQASTDAVMDSWTLRFQL